MSNEASVGIVVVLVEGMGGVLGDMPDRGDGSGEGEVRQVWGVAVPCEVE